MKYWLKNGAFCERTKVLYLFRSRVAYYIVGFNWKNVMVILMYCYIAAYEIFLYSPVRMWEIHLGWIHYELVGKRVCWDHTCKNSSSLHSYILTENPYHCPLWPDGVRRTAEGLQICVPWLRKDEGWQLCFQGSFLEKGLLTGKCGRRRGMQTLNYRNMYFFNMWDRNKSFLSLRSAESNRTRVWFSVQVW